VATHALFALKVQRKVSNGVLDWLPPPHLDRAEIAAILAISAMRVGNQRPRKHPC